MAKKRYKFPKHSNDFRDKAWPDGLYRRHRCYRFRRMYKGQIINTSLGEIPVGAAIERADNLNVQLAAGINVEKHRRQTSLTCEKFVAEFLSMKTPGWAPKSRVRYRAAYDNFLRFLGEKHRGQPLRAIQYDTAQKYMTARATAPIMPNGSRKFTEAKKEGARPKTLIFELEALRALFREAVKRKLVDSNPFVEVKVKRPTPAQVAAGHRILSDVEIKALLDAAARLDKAKGASGHVRFVDIVHFLLHTGLREGELRYLEWSDVDFEAGVIHIRPKRVRYTRVVNIAPQAVRLLKKALLGKKPEDRAFDGGGNPKKVVSRLPIQKRDDLMVLKVSDMDLANKRITLTRETDWKPKASSGSVPMSRAVVRLLERLKKETETKSNFVFAHEDGGPCRMDLLEKLKAAQKSAEIKGRLRIHDLRHSCAARLRRKGVALETIMGILRHADIRETLLYAPYHVEEGRKAVQLLDD